MENFNIANLDTTGFLALVIPYVLRLLGALVVLFIGWKLIGMAGKRFSRLMEKREVERSLRTFVISLTSTLLWVLLLISVLGMMGIEMTSFIAILGAAGLAIGLALSGALQNFAGGVMILLFKPFRTGDFIEGQGHMGTVSEINIFNTILKTPDNKTIIIPNGKLSTDSMINFSTEPQRRVDWKFGIAYGDNSDMARKVLLELLENDVRILKIPAPFIALSELGDSSVNFTVRAWVLSGDYWPVFFDLNEKVYNIFAGNGLNIPFPQMDIHVHQTNGKLQPAEPGKRGSFPVL
jgi:small conductance mechanosensitive channel